MSTITAPAEPFWGFYSQKQSAVIARIKRIDGDTPECCIYADALGAEHRVTTVERSHLSATHVRSRWPDAGPVVALTRWVRNEPNDVDGVGT